MSATRAQSGDEAVITLPSDREILVTRSFNAPPRLVFEAWTTPEHLRMWYGCPEAPLVVCEVDLRVGGSWRHVIRLPDGTEHTFSGVYTEVNDPSRLAYSQTYEEIPGVDSEVIVTFQEDGDTTHMSKRIIHRSRQNRDGQLAAGMESGTDEALDRLSALVAELVEGAGHGT